MLRVWTSYNYRIASHFLSVLINGDASGMTDAEEKTFTAWEEEARASAVRNGYSVGHWTDATGADGTGADAGDCESFARCEISGMHAMCMWVSLMVYKEDADAWAEVVRGFNPEHFPMPEGFEIPAGFEITSWHNDACPSITQHARNMRDGYAVRVWIDAASAMYRDNDAGARFCVSFYNADSEACAYDSPVISDNWADVEEFINAWNDSPTFDRFDICEAYYLLESDHNVGGWLRERPSNRRRASSVGVQLHRMQFKPAPTLSYATLSENGKAIYWQAARRMRLIGATADVETVPAADMLALAKQMHEIAGAIIKMRNGRALALQLTDAADNLEQFSAE